MSNALPPLSVVMPSLNQVDFISAAVRSVMEQGIDDLELVVVDGGSTDGTQQRLAALADAYPGRIRWQSGPDGGPAAAINQAVRMARAELLGWLNSDDLYTPGAVSRALKHFVDHPRDQMVYGHGEHVDLFGATVERYPTRGPDTPLEAFTDGCFLCQPTVFLRRSAWLASGGLDESLRASFDFDLWLRMFKAYPGQIGFIDAVQARSRLHHGGITLRLREQVAFEGLKVLRRHLGRTPPTWLLTHFAERCEQHPFEPKPLDLRAEMAALVQRAAPLLDAAAQSVLMQRLEAHRGVHLSAPSIYLTVFEDGWAPRTLEMRWRQPDPPARGVRLKCRHSRPGGGPLRLRAMDGAGADCGEWVVPDNGPFSVDLPLADQRPDARLLLRLTTPDTFVPADVEPRSGDRRALAFLVEGWEALD